jgi:hypothetical protein
MHYISTHPIISTLFILALIIAALKWANYELKHAIPEPQQKFQGKVVDIYSIEKKDIEDRLDHHEEAISN